MSAIWDARKKKEDVELLYNSVHRMFNQLEKRCGRESQHPTKWALRLPIELLEIRPVGEKMLEWGPSPREAGPPGPRLSNSGDKKETLLWPKEWGSICCSSVQSPTPSHTQPFQIKWDVYFSKKMCRSSSLCRRFDSACKCICVYIVGHGYTTLLRSKIPYNSFLL